MLVFSMDHLTDGRGGTRFISPKTGKGWEGVGVIPHVRTEADTSLDALISLVRELLNLRR